MSTLPYAVECKPAAEAQAARHLRRQIPDVLDDLWFPQYWAERRCNGQVMPALLPVFGRYIFVEVDLDNQRWRSINGTRGVKGFLQFGTMRPVAIPRREFARLRERIGDEPKTERELLGLLEDELMPGDQVQITDGPFTSFTAWVLSIIAGRAKVDLQMFGRGTEAEMDVSSLRRVEHA